MDVVQMTETEWADRKRLEKIVEDNIVTWMQVGFALKEIQERKLYRTTHETWEKYVRDRFDIARSTSYQLTSGVQVIENVRNADIEFAVLPDKEALVRPLSRLEASEQPNAWQSAIMRAHELGSEKVQAKHVAWAVNMLRGEPTPRITRRINEHVGELPEGFKEAFSIITEQIYLAKKNRFKDFDRKKMIQIIDGLKRLLEG